MSGAIAIVEALAWPSCVVACVWIVARAFEHFARMHTAELRDASVAEAKSSAAAALQAARQTQDDWIAKASQLDADLSSVKSALME